MVPKSPNFCALPFDHIQVRNNGDFDICCEHQTPSHALVNINSHDHLAWINSDYVQSVRQSFIAGEKHPGCSACWKKEDRGFDSLRLRCASEYRIFPDRPDRPVKNVEIVLGNTCNLRCLMCNEKESSAILAENVRLGVNQIQQTELSWQQTGYDHVQKILDLRPYVLNIRGGEPFYNKKLLEIIEDIPTSQAQNMVLHICTNATVWNQQWQQLLKKFRLVRFMFSVDAVGKLYEYIRYPASWSIVETNIKSMMAMENAKSLVHCVGQNLNISYLKSLIEWCEKYTLYLDIEALNSPGYMRLTNLPDSQKNIAVVHLNDLLNAELAPHLETFVRSSLNALEQSVFDPALWQTFKTNISMRDNLRGNSFRNFIKEQSC
jgi:molybdenum cofactor biosynthesis enzyme MoaA